jgi:hypothetical protein
MTSTKLQTNTNYRNSKSPHPIPLPKGERDGVRGGGNWNLGMEAYWLTRQRGS